MDTARGGDAQGDVSWRVRPCPLFAMYARILIGALLLLRCPGEATPSRPHVVIIMADDLGYSDIGAYGGEIATPHLDRLAQRGLRFRTFYNAGRCCPTRAALLTGQYPHRVGMGAMVSSLGSAPAPGPYQGYLSDDAVTLAEMLRDAGYRTYMSGKWHIGEKPEHWPRRRGFDRYFGLISGASSYYELIHDQGRVRQMALDDTSWEPTGDDFYMTDEFSRRAVDFLGEHEASFADDPFFLYLAYTAPHWPLHAPPEDIDKYRKRYDIGWDSLRAERHARMLDLGVIDHTYDPPGRPAGLAAWEEVEDKQDWALRMAVYAAMIDRMDQGIGQVVAQLEAMGALDNTLLFFLSDNGGCAESVEGRRLHDNTKAPGERGSYVAYQEGWAYASNTPFRLYKQWAHEGGIATPLIAHWPRGVARTGRIVDEAAHVIDLMATLGDITGMPVSSDGKSFLPVFSSAPSEDASRALYWEHIGNGAVRQGRWKLVRDRRLERWELYDLETDPTETRDLAARYPQRARQLEEQWRAWADSVGVFARDQ